MTDVDKGSLEPERDSPEAFATALLSRYGFDLGGSSAAGIIQDWRQQYPVEWLRPAVIEALYQGRYKAVSVEQILTFWQRRGRPLCHFNHEFERIICSKFPEILAIARQGETVPEPLPGVQRLRALRQTAIAPDQQPVPIAALGTSARGEQNEGDRPLPEPAIAPAKAEQIGATQNNGRTEKPLPVQNAPSLPAEGVLRSPPDPIQPLQPESAHDAQTHDLAALLENAGAYRPIDQFKPGMDSPPFYEKLRSPETSEALPPRPNAESREAFKRSSMQKATTADASHPNPQESNLPKDERSR